MEKSQTNYNSQEIISLESVNKEDVKAQILEIRGYRVMLDKDIALYFGVTTGNLNKVLASGEFNHFEPIENSQFQTNKKSHCHNS